MMAAKMKCAYSNQSYLVRKDTCLKHFPQFYSTPTQISISICQKCGKRYTSPLKMSVTHTFWMCIEFPAYYTKFFLHSRSSDQKSGH